MLQVLVFMAKALKFHFRLTELISQLALPCITKKSNELMAYTYNDHLFGLKTTGLRFFFNILSRGRPDMACFLFTRAIVKIIQLRFLIVTF